MPCIVVPEKRIQPREVVPIEGLGRIELGAEPEKPVLTGWEIVIASVGFAGVGFGIFTHLAGGGFGKFVLVSLGAALVGGVAANAASRRL